jgi:hypothetical protein
MRMNSMVSALRRAITEVKQRWSVLGWVTKIYYLELLRASEAALQSLAPTRTGPAWWVMARSPYV